MKEIFTANVQLSSFALKLREKRLEKNYSYKDLSDLSGIAVSKLVSFEYDKEIPNHIELLRLKELLDIK